MKTFFGWVPSSNLSVAETQTTVLLSNSSLEPGPSNQDCIVINEFSDSGPSNQNCTTISEFPDSSPSSRNCITFNEFSDSDALDLTDLSRLWSLEMVGIKPCELENDHDKAIDHFRQTARILSGRYEVCWPWIHENPELPSNYRIARARLTSFVNSSDHTLLTNYDKVFKEYVELGIIEEAPPQI